MEVGGLYQFVLVIILVGMLIGAGVLALDKLKTQGSSTLDENATFMRAVGNASSEIGGIATNWLGLIITIAVLAIIITLVVRSFGGQRR